jgi:transposase InsO family protein
MRYEYIEEQQKHHAIELLCDVLEVSRSGYYSFQTRGESKRSKEDKRLEIKIKTSFKNSRNTYGYRRIVKDLKEQQESCGKHRAISLMKRLDLRTKARRKFKATTNSSHNKPIYENLLNRQFKPAQINQSWVSDITYIATKEGWLYLAAIMDLYSRNIIGWAMEKRMTDELVINALKMALFKRKISSGLLLHSDRGTQYASHDYQALLKNQDIKCSMSGKGNCYDNSPMESFFHSLKVECIYSQTFNTRNEAKSAIFDYIEIFYNRQRKHSSLNYMSPVNYELALANF